MRWFRRDPDPEAAGGRPVPGPDEDDRPEALLRSLDELDGWINRQSGRLPGTATVRARWIIDVLREIVSTSQVRDLEIHTVLLVRGMTGDYLPTSLQAYLALAANPRGARADESARARQALLDQLDLLHRSAGQTLVAARNADADTLMTQGHFLRAKFTRSDLDLT